MKKRIYIIVEGQTEESFVNEILAKYLLQYDIYVFPSKIETSKGHKGGFVNYDHLKRDVNIRLKQMGNDILVTTFVDYFRCPELPHKESYINITDHQERVRRMENVISDDIDDWRFIPYIQLHEFEALLFSSDKGFKEYFTDKENIKLNYIINEFDNPEEINSNPESAPSKRLLKIVDNYNKVIYGNVIALEIGIETILSKCPRFRSWVESLIARAQS